MKIKITLLSALPHSRLDVEEARPNPRKDYVRAILKGYRVSSDAIWSKLQTVLEIQANQLFRVCEEFEVAVMLRAGMPELTVAAEMSDIIIILAHWKAPIVSYLPSDVVGPPSSMDRPLLQCVGRRILAADKTAAKLVDMHERAARDALARWLNEAIGSWQNWLPYEHFVRSDDQTVIVSSALGRNYARSVIDDIFGDECLLPGARLELADGLWRPADIAACFPDGWCGVCDFFCCTSEYLAEETKCQRPEALFRADSRCLIPKQAFAALGEMIPRFRYSTTTTGGWVSHYMNLAYECDLKFGGNHDDHYP